MQHEDFGRQGQGHPRELKRQRNGDQFDLGHHDQGQGRQRELKTGVQRSLIQQLGSDIHLYSISGHRKSFPATKIPEYVIDRVSRDVNEAAVRNYAGRTGGQNPHPFRETEVREAVKIVLQGEYQGYLAREKRANSAGTTSSGSSGSSGSSAQPRSESPEPNDYYGPPLSIAEDGFDGAQ